MKINNETLTIIILFISVIFLLIVFVSIIKFYLRKIDKYSYDMPVHYSKGIIDIENKIVEIEELNKIRKHKKYKFEIEDFIYMLSINPESKNFREILKLVNNGSNKKSIIKKLNSTEENFKFIIDYSEKRRTLVLGSLNPNQEVEDKIYFQLTNNELTKNLKKTHIKKDFLDSVIKPINDVEIYNGLIKTSKKFLTKGATLLKISPKYKFIGSKKDYFLNLWQITTLKKEMESININSYIGRDGSLYAIVANDRKKSIISVQKFWETKIKNIFNKIKRIEYVDGDIEDLKISAFITNGKDSKSINSGLIFLNLISEDEKNGIEEHNYSELIAESRSLNNSADEIIKNLKEKKPPIRVVKNSIIERGTKPVNEVYIDYPIEILDPILKYSFKHKKEIYDLLIKFANKEAAKLKEQPTVVNIDLFLINELKKTFESEKFRKNFYVLIKEKEKVLHLHNELLTASKLLNDNGIKIIQNIESDLGGNIDIYRIFKPEYILLSRGIDKSTISSDNFKLRLNNILNNKEKETKIINIK